MKTSIILNAAFKGNTEANSVKNQDEAYIAVWNPYDKDSLYYTTGIYILKCNYLTSLYKFNVD